MSVNEKMTAIANAIRAKTGGTSNLGLDDMPTEIASIEAGIDTSDATAAAGDILSGKTAYVKGSKITGNIATKTSSNLTASGKTVTVPAGYYASQATKSVSTATQATPSITVSNAGLITASATQTAGYVSAGTKSATKQLTTKAAATITPGTSDQTIAASTYLTGTQTIKGDSNLKAANIVSGVSIFGIAGTFEGGSSEIKTGTFTNADKYVNGNKAITITGLGGKPSLVFVFFSHDTNLSLSTASVRVLAFATNIDGVQHSLAVYYSASKAILSDTSGLYNIEYTSDGFTLSATASTYQTSAYEYTYVAIM